MKDILIVRHVPHEGLGCLADTLDQRRLPYRVIRLDQGDAVLSQLDAISALVFMGGPMSVNDDLPWIPPVLALIRQAIAADLPVLGHWLAVQLIARALGAVITRNPVKEIGWLPVQVVDGSAARDWLVGLPREFEVFHWHGETFSIPDGAVRILSSAACPNQGFVFGNVLALQCHVEMTGEMVREWARLGGAEIAHPSATIQSAQAITSDLDARISRLQAIAERLYQRLDEWARRFVIINANPFRVPCLTGPSSQSQLLCGMRWQSLAPPGPIACTEMARVVVP